MPFGDGSRVLALAGFVATLGIAASLSPLGFTLEEDTGLSRLFQLRGPRPAPPEAVVVRYDLDGLARLQTLPAEPAAWPQPLAGCAARNGPLRGLADATSLARLDRGVQACLVEELTRRGAAVIAFDISFRRDRGREDGVPALARAIRAHGSVVLLDFGIRRVASAQGEPSSGAGATVLDWLQSPHQDLAREAIATAPFLLPRGSARQHQVWATNPALPVPRQLPFRALEAQALPALARLAERTGVPTPPGLSRAELFDHHTAWFRAQVVSAASELGIIEQAQLAPEDARLLAALARVYRGPDGYYVNYYGPAGTFPSISVADLLVPDPERGSPASAIDLRGRVVFVGQQELGIPQADDTFATAFQSPLGVNLGGVEIAATAYANLLHDETLLALPEWARVALVAALGFAFTLASCLGMVWRGLALTLALAGAYAAIAVAGFIGWQLWLPVVVPLLGLLPLAIGLGQAVHYLGAARWLGIYAPRQVSRRLLGGRDLAAGAAQTREVSVMLTDIVGFTTLAEPMTPAAVSDFVNRHFTMLNACVEGEGGTVAQFIGDSVMSFWGAPDPQPDHAARACRAALAIGRALEAENARRAREGQPPVRMRIGINTGMVTAGNVGAPGRSNYGIVGDTVNATQRIEQLAKTLCQDRPTVAILVSARTREQAGVGFRFGEVGAHELRGRRELVMIYRLDTAPLPAERRPPALASLDG